jgi:hypothetical protein
MDETVILDACCTLNFAATGRAEPVWRDANCRRNQENQKAVTLCEPGACADTHAFRKWL